MRIDNIRLGLATNSSSSHSLIFLRPGEVASDEDVCGNEFGWHFFTAASARSKTNYLAMQVKDALAEIMHGDDYVVGAVLHSLFGQQIDTTGYVDHQSTWQLPLNWSESNVHIGFVDDLKRFLLRDDVVVLGGNDNTDEEHPLFGSGKHIRLMDHDCPSKGLVCRKDGAHWILFNRTTGGKTRITFDDSAPEYRKSSAPELVDIKITDFCPYNCPFCYQASTEHGKHAEYDLLRKLAYVMGEMHVFEVAIGGGEPTLHPSFTDILRIFRHYGIVPNFTTKSLAWLRDEELRPEILESAGAFAYSVDHSADVQKLAELVMRHKVNPSRVNIQVVMGAVDEWYFSEIVKAAANANFRVTLLGFKRVGRGDKYKPKPYGWWLAKLKEIRKEKHIPVSIDTALAAEFKEELAAADVPQQMFHTEEGKFSAYIDAVSKQCGPSSYCDKSQYVPLPMGRYGDFDEESFRDVYAKW